MLRLALTFTFAFALSAPQARAHDPGLSSATVDFSSHEILVQIAFAPADLAALRTSSSADLAAVAEHSAELLSAGAPLRANTVAAREVGADNVEYILRYPRPAQGPVTFRAPLFARLPLGHRQALTVRDEAGTTVATELLSAAHDRAPLPVPASPARSPSLPTSGAFAVLALVALVVAALTWFPRRLKAAA